MIPSQRSRLGLRSRDISDSNVLDDVQLSSSPSPALPRSSPTSPSVGNSNQQFPLGLLIPNLFKTSLGPTSTQAESTGGSNGASKKSSEAAPSHRGEEEVGAERSERESTTITRSSRTAGVGGKYVPALDTRGAWATEFRSNSAGSGGSGCSPEGRGSTVSTLAGGDCSSGPELASGSRQRETMAVTGVTGKLAITRVREERGGGGVATAGAAVARWWWFTIVVRTAQLVTGLVGVSCCAAFFYGIWDGHYHEHTPDFYLAVGVGQVLLNTALLIYTSTRRPFAPTYARSERLFHGVVPCAYDTITCSLWAACAAFSRVWVQQCNGDVEQLVEGGIEPFDCIRVSVALAAAIANSTIAGLSALCLVAVVIVGLSVRDAIRRQGDRDGDNEVGAAGSSGPRDPIRGSTTSLSSADSRVGSRSIKKGGTTLERTASERTMAHVGVMSGVRSSMTGGRSILSTAGVSPGSPSSTGTAPAAAAAAAAALGAFGSGVGSNGGGGWISRSSSSSSSSSGVALAAAAAAARLAWP